MSEDRKESPPGPTPIVDALTRLVKGASRWAGEAAETVMTQATAIERRRTVDYLRHRGATVMADLIERGEHVAWDMSKDGGPREGR